MTMDVYMGRKFDRNHQLAILLARHLGLAKAEQTCHRNGWDSVLRALREQREIVPIPA